MDPTSRLEVGKRYINAKTRQPLTLLYIGPLRPPTTTTSTSTTSDASSSTPPQWLGVEYDDPTHGKGHSGTYEGTQVFQTRQEGAGAFIRLRTGTELVEGKPFVQAFRERYGLDQDQEDGRGVDTGPLILGSSGSAIVVEAPGMEGVQRRLRQLERLKQIGLEDELVCGVGGTEEQRSEMRTRLGGVTLLNLSRNLLTSWEDVVAIIGLLPGLDTLILNGSRLASPANTDLNALNQLKEIHLANSLISWADLRHIGAASEKLEELHLSENTSILPDRADYDPLPGFQNLKVLDLSECGIISWPATEAAFGHLSSLQVLDISMDPLAVVQPLDTGRRFAGLRSLILLSTPLRDLASLANLSDRIPDLTSLLFGIDRAIAEKAGQGGELCGNMDDDRGILVALFPKLEVLNGTDVKGKEREEAERRFVNTTRSTSSAAGADTALHRRVKALAVRHDLQGPSQGTRAPVVQPTSLRSKLITLHVYPEHKEAFTISLLPSSPITLLKRKISKKVGLNLDDLKIYTVRRNARDGGGEDDEVWTREKVAEVEDGEVGYWFGNGDGVMVEVCE